jgi:hypothetical protein
VVGQPSRVQNSFGTSAINFFKIQDVHSYVSTMYIEIHIFKATVLIYFLLDSGGGRGSNKVLAASPQPEDSES